MSTAQTADALDPAASLDRVVAVAREHAVAVDRDGRFPVEAIAAMREEGLLAALAPQRVGGLGQPLRQAAAACYAIARGCSSSAMVLAMHHIQVASLVNHAGDSMWLRRFLGAVGTQGLLLASVTSEAGVGGSMRTSVCAVETTSPGRFSLVKQATTVSYGAYADALLVTARSNPEADASDQVLVVVPTEPGVLARTGGWNAMGMRGTCSEAFVVSATGDADQVFPTPFAKISSDTMVPVSHLLWSSLWCGIAADAATRARAFLRAKMRRGQAALPDGADRLVRVMEQLQAVEARVRAALADHVQEQPDQSFAAIAATNMLKTYVSSICLEIVEEAMLICGFAGYANEGPYSLSRHLRDLHSARLMIHNDRVRGNTARLLMMQSPALGIG